ncbi:MULTISPECIES: UTP--glucose-1-phosphate uridylyltransferase GalU [unclassified Gemella]|uniref:UTP--glucose-1-phosphate uridylyltransferase GalU n=1 Tax=unclassified Gemella TaxID=2624949 RepID=UPI0010731E11|nr:MULTISPECIES: UTP--glucose-1-phosphate uridylyltransferase GalU [unclassified Gemella]MBF0709835.1 UTP--glucose-1-phosphate uridylyltransferase GalU [Gemella sp. GL1.1]MBF0746860.1 UTP--glucose-1-phosphate uridylyltransferase GalU [Gemella sp. 19428wG2_WT2a]NYS27179.1 UTP--glucose-1-phosphate uridylyltransferase GalU [Gemella sp. GL1]TFU59583.1 UTP--glucose-1-phosphate uridylyltransferase GalU [Gemella sp. WT2a]
MKKVRKAIIPAAGYGTRFLPATKAIPKEMLPIINKPTLQYIVEEAVAAGIEDIIIVTGKQKRAIEDHFDKNFELEYELNKKEKFNLLEKVKQPSELANIHYVRQKEMAGLGDAILTAKSFIGDEPFVVLLGDDIVVNELGDPATKQLVDQYEKTNSSVIGVQTVADNATHRYGIIDPASQDDRLYEVTRFVEKPAPGTAPSNLAILGRYLLTPGIFKHLEKKYVGAGGEIQLTDAIQMLNEEEKVYAYDFKGNRYDVGETDGFIKTTIDFALKSELRDDILAYMKEKIDENEK